MRSLRVAFWILTIAAILAALAAGSLWLFANRPTDTVAAVVGLLALGFMVAAALINAARTNLEHRRPPTPRQRDEAAGWLIEEMRMRLRDAGRYRALTTPELLALRWRVDAPRALGVTSPFGRGAEELAGLIEQVEPQRAALIGEGGAGKTTLAALVASELIERDAERRRVPVILSMTDWNPRVHSFEKWLALRLAAEFPELGSTRQYGEDMAAALVTYDRVLPIIDDLDSVSDDMLQAVARRIRDASPGSPLIVVCRTAQFQAAASGGQMAPRMLTVELEPLSAADVAEFLEAAADARPPNEQAWWTMLAAHLRGQPGDALTIALDTPLNVWLLWASYGRPGRDPTPLLDRRSFPTVELLEQHLLQTLLPTILAERSEASATRATRHLAFIARRLASQEANAIAWWQIPYFLPTSLRRIVTTIVAGILMLPLLLSDDPSSWIAFTLILGLVPRLEPRSPAYVMPLSIRGWETTRDRFRRSVGIGVALAASVAWSFSAARSSLEVGSPVGIALVAVFLGFMYLVISELTQAMFAKAQRKLRLPERTPTTRDAPPPVAGFSWDWSRAALVAAVGALFGTSVSTLHGAGPGLIAGVSLTASLTPFACFGSSSLSATVHRQALLFRRSAFYSATRGMLFTPVALAVILPIVLFDESNSIRDDTATYEALAIVGVVATWIVLLTLWFAAVSLLIAAPGQYLVSIIALSTSRRLPLRPLRFLDQMHGLGVLREAGLGYEFRHQRLRDTIADWGQR